MKERLLGAAVLIVAAVIVIPAVLDGPGQPQTVSQEITLPAPATPTAADPVRTHTVEVQPDQTSEPEPVVEPEVVTIDQEPPVSVPPAPVPPARQVIEQAAVDAPSATAPAAAPAPPPAGWAVQVGSFTSETNARRLVEHLRDADYTAFVVRNVVNGRVMFRVRVGPVPDRERAQQLAERLQEDRQQTQLVRHP
ncbi:MAG: SPOR domain-containing protein [Gammaproteobacteria bacterium]|nr:SPOR domain-containing protein [Gammaproteobacteria bacterium]NNF62070.1 SPOR domain-containing protein [Gammaproteobacteria bacterium]NNM20681.1 SPOR domain-containing protein [Gammaproteobacteria bacterium]